MHTIQMKKAGHRSNGDRPGRITPYSPPETRQGNRKALTMLSEPPARRGNDLQSRILGSLVRTIVASRGVDRVPVLHQVARQAAGHVRGRHLDRADAMLALIDAALAVGIRPGEAGRIVSEHLAPKKATAADASRALGGAR